MKPMFFLILATGISALATYFSFYALFVNHSLLTAAAHTTDLPTPAATSADDRPMAERIHSIEKMLRRLETGEDLLMSPGLKFN